MRIPTLFVCTLAPLAAATAQSWKTLSPKTQPPLLDSHAMAGELTNRRIVMTGGAKGQGDTWTWDGKDWSRHRTGLPVLEHPCMSFDVLRNRTVLFGGSVGIQDQNDTYEWDGATWSKLQPATRPSVRSGACMAYDWQRGVTVLFGGASGYSIVSDTWTFDGKDWKQVQGPGPSPRAHAAMCYDQRRKVCVLFGGVAQSDLSDTWEWDGARWKHVVTSKVPMRRWGHVLVYDFARGVVLLSGGLSSSASRFANDTWAFDGTEWEKLVTVGHPLSKRHAAAAYDHSNARTLLYGGTSKPNETWHFELGSPASYNSYGAGCLGSAGVPVLAAALSGLPKLGTSFGAEIRSLPGGAPVVLALGFTDRSWGPVPLPYRMDIFGAPGCSILASLDLLTPLASAGGVARQWIPIPNDQKLVGVGWFHQALVLDPAANALGISFSNGAAARIGTR